MCNEYPEKMIKYSNILHLNYIIRIDSQGKSNPPKYVINLTLIEQMVLLLSKTSWHIFSFVWVMMKFHKGMHRRASTK